MLKVNKDGSSLENLGPVRVGELISDSQGNWVKDFSRTIVQLELQQIQSILPKNK